MFESTATAAVCVSIPLNQRWTRPELRVVEVLGERALAGALGDDRAQRAGVGGGLEQELAPDRETEPADARRIDVRLAAQERERGAEIALAGPSERVVVALAAPSPRRSSMSTP